MKTITGKARISTRAKELLADPRRGHDLVTSVLDADADSAAIIHMHGKRVAVRTRKLRKAS
jgi:hypothetical protein